MKPDEAEKIQKINENECIRWALEIKNRYSGLIDLIKDYKTKDWKIKDWKIKNILKNILNKIGEHTYKQGILHEFRGLETEVFVQTQYYKSLNLMRLVNDKTQERFDSIFSNCKDNCKIKSLDEFLYEYPQIYFLNRFIAKSGVEHILKKQSQ